MKLNRLFFYSYMYFRPCPLVSFFFFDCMRPKTAHIVFERAGRDAVWLSEEREEGTSYAMGLDM